MKLQEEMSKFSSEIDKFLGYEFTRIEEVEVTKKLPQ